MRIKSILSANEGKRSSKLALTSVLLMSWLPVACAQAMATERVANDREIHFVSHDDQVMHEVHEEIQIRQVEGEDGETRYEITVEGSGTPEEREARRLELLEQLENGEDGVAVFVTDARIAGHVAPEIVERLTGEDGARVAVRVHENIVLHEVDGAESDVNVFVRRIEALDGVEMTEDVLRLESAGGHVVRLGDASENVVILDVDDVDAETVRSWTTEDGGQFEVIIARDAEGEVHEWVSEDGRQVEVIVNGEPGDARVLEREGEDGETVELRVIGDTEGARRVMRHVRVERAPEAPEEPEGEPQDEPNKAPVVEPK